MFKLKIWFKLKICLVLLGGTLASINGIAQDVGTKSESKTSLIQNDASEERFTLDGDARSILEPLFLGIQNAKVSRATVSMLADSVLAGQVVNSTEATFQVAAQTPDRFTVYMKEPRRRTRVYCDGEKMIAAMAPDAYVEFPKPISIQDAVTSLPLPMGPYPEPLLALCMAGTDPSVSFVDGMKSVKLMGRKKLRGKINSIHFHGVQTDEVTWDLWLTDTDKPTPLRLLIDLTPMLQASKDVFVPDGYSSQIRYDFLSWRISGEIDERLFAFGAAESAIRYDSLEHYAEAIEAASPNHEMLGKEAPKVTGTTIADEPFDSSQWKGKIVVLDFCASWCKACKVGLRTNERVVSQFANKDVVFWAVHTGENLDKAKAFFDQAKVSADVLVDEDGVVANAFGVKTLPHTLVIGKDGLIESVHLGFVDEESLTKRLTDELDVLTRGGKIGSISNVETNP